MLRVFLWFFSEARTPVVWPMLRNILRLKWAFHCPAPVRFVYLCVQTFRRSRTEPEECQLGRVLGLSRERQCLCHTLLWTAVFPHFVPQTFALNAALKTVVGDSSRATFILQCVGRKSQWLLCSDSLLLSVWGFCGCGQLITAQCWGKRNSLAFVLLLFSAPFLSSSSAPESYGQTRKQRWVSPLARKINISNCVKVEFLWPAAQPGLLYRWNGNTSLGPTSKAWQKWNRRNIFKYSSIIFAPFSFYLNVQLSSWLIVWCIILLFTHGSCHHIWCYSYVM